MCDQCNAICINHTNCHEEGCPNSWKDAYTGEPLPFPCWTCGFNFTPEEKPHKYVVCPGCAIEESEGEFDGQDW